MMTGSTIADVTIHPLRRIPDARGAVMHMLRRDDPWFDRFGEIYFSMVYPGAIKGWHIHTRMTLNYAVVIGTIRLVIYDDREQSSTRGVVQEIVTGEDNYALITVPAGLWNGFTGLGTTPAIVANCATEPHDPDEIERVDPHAPGFPYTWRVDTR